jgi:hypothetical protein
MQDHVPSQLSSFTRVMFARGMKPFILRPLHCRSSSIPRLFRSRHVVSRVEFESLPTSVLCFDLCHRVFREIWRTEQQTSLKIQFKRNLGRIRRKKKRREKRTKDGTGAMPKKDRKPQFIILDCSHDVNRCLHTYFAVGLDAVLY